MPGTNSPWTPRDIWSRDYSPALEYSLYGYPGLFGSAWETASLERGESLRGAYGGVA